MRTNTLSPVLVEIGTKAMCWIHESADTFHLNPQDSFIPPHGLQLMANTLPAKWSRYPDSQFLRHGRSNWGYILSFPHTHGVSKENMWSLQRPKTHGTWHIVVDGGSSTNDKNHKGSFQKRQKCRQDAALKVDYRTNCKETKRAVAKAVRCITTGDSKAVDLRRLIHWPWPLLIWTRLRLHYNGMIFDLTKRFNCT